MVADSPLGIDEFGAACLSEISRRLSTSGRPSDSQRRGAKCKKLLSLLLVTTVTSNFLA